MNSLKVFSSFSLFHRLLLLWGHWHSLIAKHANWNIDRRRKQTSFFLLSHLMKKKSFFLLKSERLLLWRKKRRVISRFCNSARKHKSDFEETCFASQTKVKPKVEKMQLSSLAPPETETEMRIGVCRECRGGGLNLERAELANVRRLHRRKFIANLITQFRHLSFRAREKRQFLTQSLERRICSENDVSCPMSTYTCSRRTMRVRRSRQKLFPPENVEFFTRTFHANPMARVLKVYVSIFSYNKQPLP